MRRKKRRQHLSSKWKQGAPCATKAEVNEVLPPGMRVLQTPDHFLTPVSGSGALAITAAQFRAPE